MTHTAPHIYSFSIFFTILATVLLTTISLSLANDAQDKRFTNYITKNSQYKTLLKLNNDKAKKLTFPNCDNPITYKRLKPNILIPTSFAPKENKQPHPGYGQWIEKSIITACDNQTVFNNIVIAGNVEKTPTFFPIINGQTKIDQIYQSATLQKITDKLKNHETRCHGKLFVKNTGILGYRNPKTNALSKTDQHGGWFERWIVDACSKSYGINIAILPDPRSTYRFIVSIAQ